MLKKIRDKKNKGFTLAELLIVVAIIAVLVAIAIPIFTAQLDKSKLRTATANVRSAYAEVTADALASGDGGAATSAAFNTKLAEYDSEGCSITVGASTVTISNGAGEDSVSVEWASE